MNEPDLGEILTTIDFLVVRAESCVTVSHATVEASAVVVPGPNTHLLNSPLGVLVITICDRPSLAPDWTRVSPRAG